MLDILLERMIRNDVSLAYPLKLHGTPHPPDPAGFTFLVSMLGGPLAAFTLGKDAHPQGEYLLAVAGAPVLAGLAEESLGLFHYTLQSGGYDIAPLGVMASLYALEGFAYTLGRFFRGRVEETSHSR